MPIAMGKDAAVSRRVWRSHFFQTTALRLDSANLGILRADNSLHEAERGDLIDLGKIWAE